MTILPTRAGRVRTPASLLRELALVAALFLLYRVARGLIDGQDQAALATAEWVWRVERFLHLPDEEVLQDWFLQWPDLVGLANWYYVGAHFPVTVLFLAYGWWRRPPPEYRWARRLLTALTALAVVVHVLMPLAPPRMLGHLGLVDTMAVIGPSAYAGDLASVANQFAAMPSLHVGWALAIAVVVVRTASSQWRWVALAHPVVTVAVVVVTANHFWVDALVAALLLLAVLLVMPAPARSAADDATGRPHAISTRSTSSSEGCVEPPTGSTVTPRLSAEPMSSTKAASSLPLPRTPADRECPSSISQSW